MIFLRIAKKIKVLVRRILPSYRKKLKALKLEEEKRKSKIKFLLNEIFQGDVLQVMNGPFQGMKYIATSNGSQLLPKILGSYEEPIHEWVRERALAWQYETIIDVGCAEGYYAVGFALKSPKSKIIAFDIDTSALANARQLAMINKVDHRVEFSEKFDADCCAVSCAVLCLMLCCRGCKTNVYSYSCRIVSVRSLPVCPAIRIGPTSSEICHFDSRMGLHKDMIIH